MTRTKQSPIELVIFDMEGTIFRKTYKTSVGNTAPSAWTLISQHLGPEALIKEQQTKERWNRGGYDSYVEWMRDTIGIHQKHGLTKKFFEEVISGINYHPGVRETFEVLRGAEVRTALISGGFKAQADRALRDLKIDHAFAACEYFWDDRGNLIHWNLLPCDYEGKIDFMNLLMNAYKLNREEVAFVGDGKNDIPFAKVVGTSISFNGAPELQAVSTYSINQPEGREDFRAVLPLLGFEGE